MRNTAVEAWRWMDQAQSDLEFAEVGLREGFFAHACFLSHQAAEKAIKAVHYAGGARAVLGHSVAELLAEIHPPMKDRRLRETGILLDQYYIPTRYPNGLPSGVPAKSYTRTQAEAAVSSAGEILEATKERLPARP